MEEIAAGNPQWPQQFYPIKKDVTVNHGDYLVARCTFNNSVGDRDIHIGKYNLLSGMMYLCFILLYQFQKANGLNFDLLT